MNLLPMLEVRIGLAAMGILISEFPNTMKYGSYRVVWQFFKLKFGCRTISFVKDAMKPGSSFFSSLTKGLEE